MAEAQSNSHVGREERRGAPRDKLTDVESMLEVLQK